MKTKRMKKTSFFMLIEEEASRKEMRKGKGISMRAAACTPRSVPCILA
jgi:hypothetical protein